MNKILSTFPLIEVKNLSIIKSDRILLNKVDCKIFEKGISVILGPNGAGKSLFMRCLHGLTKPDCGEIKFNGQELSKNIRFSQSYVFQNPILLRRSVYENLLFVARQRKILNYNKVNNILALVGLEKLKELSAKVLSSGEKQRLSLGRAILLEPNYLFLDEPTSNLDPTTTLIIENLIKKVSIGGTKVVFITHDLFQAKRIADEVIFMNAGNIVEKNLSKIFFQSPETELANQFIRGLIK